MNKGLILGTILTAIIGIVAICLAKITLFANIGLSALSLSIIMGIIVGNTFYNKIALQVHDGVTFSKQKILRLGIILYGFHVTFATIASVGASGVILAITIICATFIFTYYIGVHVLKLDKQLSILISSGSAVCGAAAIMATEPVVKADSNKIAIAVAMVVIFGTIAMFVYPLLYTNFLHNFMSAEVYGVYAGATIHEVAQVVGAGKAVSESALNIAVIIKMIRVMMLAPFLIGLSIWLSKEHSQHKHQQHKHSKTSIVIPWFAVIFVGVAGFNSLHLIPKSIINIILELDTFFLAMSMGALGLHTHLYALKHAGLKPIILSIFSMAFLMIFGYVAVKILF